MKSGAYEEDLAYVHDQGYSGFARNSAAGLLGYLHEAGIFDGLVVELGCGSGVLARQLVDAGYDVLGVDLSPAMIELAQQRVPEAEFHVASFSQFPIPPCAAATALGEVFNYLFDADDGRQSLQTVCESVYRALAPGGLLIFDVAEPGRCRGRTQAFTEGDDWTCLVEYQHDEPRQQLVRRIITFRKFGDAYRRREETHRQQLFEEAFVVQTLENAGFQVRPVRNYGDYSLPDHVVGFVAWKA